MDRQTALCSSIFQIKPLFSTEKIDYMHYSDKDSKRIFDIEPTDNTYDGPYRTPWSRDLARLIHSRYFKKLQGKNQLLPGQEGDQFRNRMTHAMEVSQIAKAIVSKLNHDLKEQKLDYSIESDICEFGALAHDIGRPPFGHLGEMALNVKMKDSGGFEGNAQTLRILTKLAKKHYIAGTVLDTGVTKEGEDMRVGLNITYRSLASILKYDKKIPEKLDFDDDNNVRLIKGYYESEAPIVKSIKQNIYGNENLKDFKTIESQIVDFADDISYATYDMDDAFRIGFIKPLDILSVPDYVLTEITQKINKNLGTSYTNDDIIEVYYRIFEGLLQPPFDSSAVELNEEEQGQLYAASLRMSLQASNKLALNGYYRVNFISRLIGRFVQSIELLKINSDCPSMTKLTIPKDVRLEIEALKIFMYHSQVLSQDVKYVNYRGNEVVSTLFDCLLKKEGANLLPTDYKVIYDQAKNEMGRKRTVCDFISRLSDGEALEIYQRLKSPDPKFMFSGLNNF